MQEKTSRPMTEIDRMYYPSFSRQVKFYTDPESFMEERKVDKKSLEVRLQEIKDAKAKTERLAREKLKRQQKQAEKG